MSTSVFWIETVIELPEVREDGMTGRNEQRKPGTTRGSPRRSRTAKASRISRFAVKSRCAREWDGWGRISDERSVPHCVGPRPRLCTAMEGYYSSAPGVLARVRVVGVPPQWNPH